MINMINDYSFGTYRKGSYWNITQSLGMLDSDGDELCIKIERIGKKLNVKVEKCPTVFKTSQSSSIDIKPMTMTHYNEMLKLQNRLIEMLKRGEYMDVLKLMEQFQMLKYM